MRKLKTVFSVLALTALIAGSATAQLEPTPMFPAPVNGTIVEGAVNIIYDSDTGNITAVSQSDASAVSRPFSQILIEDKTSSFRTENCDPTVFSNGITDYCEPGSIYKFAEFGLDEPFNLGDLAPMGWSMQQVLDNWDLNGALFPGGSLNSPEYTPGGGPYLHVLPIPEPSSVTLLGLGVLGLLGIRRKRS